MLQPTNNRMKPVWLMLVLLALSITTISRPIVVHAQGEEGAAVAPVGKTACHADLNYSD